MNDGGPVFSCSGFYTGDDGPAANDTVPQPGMSLRDYFAAAATEEDVAQWIPDTTGRAIELAAELDIDPKHWAEACSRLRCWARYQHADAMLRERNRGDLTPTRSRGRSMLGKEESTERGFPIVKFRDCYEFACSLQASGLADFEEPGTCAVLLGCDEPNPLIMASQAARLGVKTKETCGWIPYPLPKEVQTTTRMHLDREQVAALIESLQAWLDTGHFERTAK